MNKAGDGVEERQLSPLWFVSGAWAACKRQWVFQKPRDSDTERVQCETNQTPMGKC